MQTQTHNCLPLLDIVIGMAMYVICGVFWLSFPPDNKPQYDSQNNDSKRKHNDGTYSNAK